MADPVGWRHHVVAGFLWLHTLQSLLQVVPYYQGGSITTLTASC